MRAAMSLGSLRVDVMRVPFAELGRARWVKHLQPGVIFNARVLSQLLVLSNDRCAEQVRLAASPTPCLYGRIHRPSPFGA